MEALTRLVTESLARHGFDRPLDYRRLHWSRWFRCESHHSLLEVPSKPGVFALAEEITEFGTSNAHVATGASPVSRSEASAAVNRTMWDRVSDPVRPSKARLGFSVGDMHGPDATVEERPFSAASSGSPEASSRKPEAGMRMLAVTQFYEDDDMAFVLDRMLSRNPMRDRLASGRYFIRYVVIEDSIQRSSICSALNQWMLSTAEKATDIGAHFATSLELTPAIDSVVESAQPGLFEATQFDATTGPTLPRTHVGADALVRPERSECASASTPAHSNLLTASPSGPNALAGDGAGTNIHCPTPFPSGF